MKKILLLSFIAMMAMGCKEGMKYPETKKGTHVDTYFGSEVADPYRWLEDDLSAETAEWVKAENAVTFDYLSKIPSRSGIKEALTDMWNYPKYGTPFKVGKVYFAFKNDGLQNQAVLYAADRLGGEQRVFLDPNALSENGTVSLGGFSASNDDRYMAYTLSAAGSDWKEIRVREIATGKDLQDVIKWVKFTHIAWYKDGFFYSGYDAPKGSALSEKNTFNRVFYHKLGTAQAADRLVFENKAHALRYNTVETTSDEQFLFLTESEGTGGNRLSVKLLNRPDDSFRTLATEMDKDYYVIENFGDMAYVQTNDGAPRYKIVRCDLAAKDPLWTTVIPESEDVIESATVVGEKLVVKYLHNAYSRLCVFNLSGKLEQEIALPEIGTAGSVSGHKGDNELFYSFMSYTTPGNIYRTDVTRLQPELYQTTELSRPLEHKYITEQVFYQSKDGTSVPMFIIYKEGTQKNGNNPTLLYGYGGFNVSITPGFSVSRMLFLENGGIYAVANLRGGGEFGEEWHLAGTKLQKQNVFDDFIAAAEYLIARQYTSPDKLAIQGGSNGGLLVGACMTQRPELFKVALPAVGVMDMLRFHTFTVGWGWVGDYGSSEQNEEMFKYLLGYSPLHNLKPGTCYPATLVTTGDHDDRVVPAHSFKFAATLQAAQGCRNPVLIRIETEAGHGAGKPTSKQIEETADIWAFTFHHLGMSFAN